jgi:hypothetical protein
MRRHRDVGHEARGWPPYLLVINIGPVGRDPVPTMRDIDRRTAKSRSMEDH